MPRPVDVDWAALRANRDAGTWRFRGTLSNRRVPAVGWAERDESMPTRQELDAMPVSSHQVPYDLGLRWSKRLHKAFQQLLPTAESVPSLMTCQTALARMLGHAHWHAFEATRARSGPSTFGPNPADHRVEGHALPLASDVQVSPDAVPTSLRIALEALIWRQGSTLYLERRHEGLQVRVRENGMVRSLRTAALDAAEWFTWAARRCPSSGEAVVDLVLAERSVRLMLVRLSTLTGEDVVVRIKAGASASASDLMALGYAPALTHQLERFVQGPGMLVVAGPVGSGASTTLRALSWMAQRHHAGRMRMTDLDAGLDATGLDAAVQAWMETGVPSHGPRGVLLPLDRLSGAAMDRLLDDVGAQAGPLVLGRLHASSSTEALVRLMDLGVSPLRLAEALPHLGVLHQTLVPRLCAHCSVPTSEASDPDACNAALNRLRTVWQDQGLGDRSALDERVRWRGPGCAHCHHQGVQGRVVLVEVFLPTASDVPMADLASMVRQRDGSGLAQRWRTRSERTIGAHESPTHQALRLLVQGLLAPNDLMDRGLF